MYFMKVCCFVGLQYVKVKLSGFYLPPGYTGQ